MSDPTVSEEIINAFVDRQLSAEDRLRVLRSIAAGQPGLGREICARQHLKALLALAYGVHLPPPGPHPGGRRGPTDTAD